MPNKRKILICGNYGVGNLGDEAILSGMIRIINSAFPSAKISVFTADTHKTKLEQNVGGISFFPAGLRSFFYFWFGLKFIQTIKTVWQADLIILGGGGLLTDEKPRAIWIWLVQVIWWKIFGKKYVCYGQSVGPLKSAWSKKIVKWIMNGAKQITVRDGTSKDLLVDIGVNGKIELFADLAFAIGYDLGWNSKKKAYIVLSLRNWVKGNSEEIYQEIINSILWLYNTHGLKTIFIPFQTDQENDYEIGNKLLSKILLIDNLSAGKESINDILVVSQKESVKTALELIAGAEMVLAMRLHANIFAAITGTPMLAISYSQKVDGFMEVVDLKENLIKYEDFNFESFKTLFNRIRKNNSEITIKLAKEKMRNTYQVFNHEKLLKELLPDKS